MEVLSSNKCRQILDKLTISSHVVEWTCPPNPPTAQLPVACSAPCPDYLTLDDLFDLNTYNNTAEEMDSD